MWRSRTPPQHRQPGHTRVGWHPILLPAFLTSESVWLCWSHWHERHTHAEPTSVRRLRSGLQAGHSILSSPELWLLINPAVGARVVGPWVPMVAESHLDLCLHWDQDVAKLTWQWKAVMTGLVAALWEQRLAVCSLVWIVWVESRQLCHSANLDSKSVEDCLCFLSSDRVRKSTSCGLIFSGRPLPSLFLTSPVYKTWPSSWSWYYGFLQIQLEVVLWHRCQTVLSAAQNKSQ